MDIKIPSENPIEIINPGNGEPGIAPCYASAPTPEPGGGGQPPCQLHSPLPVDCRPLKNANGW